MPQRILIKSKIINAIITNAKPSPKNVMVLKKIFVAGEYKELKANTRLPLAFKRLCNVQKLKKVIHKAKNNLFFLIILDTTSVLT